ncbi:MAG TPA: hypothetical protein PKC97_07120, partial [Burkholderiaceae bacterium]|nr:hypothetical protein [Burkholderiaceae bacterium]
RNFAAGMSGGVAYVYDEDGGFASRCNPAMVALERVLPAAEQMAGGGDVLRHREGGVAQADETLLRKLIESHHRWTGSLRARDILDHWAERRPRFVKVFPHEYRRALAEMHAAREADHTIAKAKVPELAAHAEGKG